MGGNYSVAIDLGGTIIKIGLILDSEIVRFTTISSDSVKGLSHMLPKMEHAIDSLLSEEGISSTDLVSIKDTDLLLFFLRCKVTQKNDMQQVFWLKICRCLTFFKGFLHISCNTIQF